ncbi:hypothetical protein [Spirosoma pomorum]
MNQYLIMLIGAVLLVAIVVFLVRKITFRKRCPVCGNRHTDRIARPRWLKAILPTVPIKSYRCLACHHNYLQIDLSATRPTRQTT